MRIDSNNSLEPAQQPSALAGGSTLPSPQALATGSDTVTLSSLWDALNGARTERLDQLRLSLAAAAYHPDPVQIARSMLDYYLVP